MDLVKQSEAHLLLLWALKKDASAIIFLSLLPSLPQRPLSGFVLVVHQERCFDIHVAAWLRCEGDSCKVLGHLLLFLCFLFTSYTFSSLSPLISCLGSSFQRLLWGCITEFVPASQNPFYVIHIIIFSFNHRTHHDILSGQIELGEGRKGERENGRKTIFFFCSNNLFEFWSVICCI